MPAQSNFCTTIPDLQFGWDSTSIGLLKTCPKKYYYSVILGKVSRGQSIHLSFGIAYHKALEIFDRAIAKGHEEMDALRMAVSFCLTFSDPVDRDPNKNRLTLTRSVVWYIEHWRREPYKTVVFDDGSAAVEYSFQYGLDITTPDGNEFLYAGHLDKLVEDEHGDYFWLDKKTTKSALDDRFFDGFTPSTQMSGYAASSQISLPKPAKAGIIDGVQLLVSGSRFARRKIHRTPGQLAEWYKDIQFWVRQAQRFAEENYWPMNESACDNYGGCPFRQVCSKDPSVRERFLSANYVDWHWNPLEARGEV